MTPLLKAALEYAQRGWPVLPLYSTINSQCSCGKQNCSTPAKHPRINSWRNEASTDFGKITQWWTQWPLANIGILTGEKSGLVVIDVDPRNGGFQTLEDLETKYGKLPYTIESQTGGKGRHILFSYPDVCIKGGSNILGSGIDIKSEGGYIVAPPSKHISGQEYTWEVSSDPSEIPIVPLPPWLLKQLTNRIQNNNSTKGSNSSGWIRDTLNELKEGNRNNSFARLIDRLHHDKHSEEEILEILTPHAEKTNFSIDELKSEIHGICTRYPLLKNNKKQKNSSYASRAYSTKNWPVLKEEALYGLAGEIVGAIDPYTEADPVALLTNLLTAFGNSIGAIPYFAVGHSKHYPRIFIGQVGETSKGRKGTGWSPIRYLMEQVDEEWASDRIVSGLSSGEGLIYQVRDKRWKKKIKKSKGKITSEQEELEDEGVSDKRLLVVEEELASPLKVMCREGNTLSPIIRTAWDRGDLKSLVKNNPIKATGAHISIIGHITIDELNRCLNETEKSNGFANRFDWFLVRRSKILPNPLPIPQEIINRLVLRLEKTLHAARKTAQMKRDEEAEALWKEVYGALSEGKPGLLGSILARAEAQVTRFSTLYALIDSSEIITLPHLKAALELWNYSEASTKIIFGNKLGDLTADRILEALNTQFEMSETELYYFFDNHKTSAEIQRALHFLEQLKLVHQYQQSTNGRPKTVWRPA